MRPLRAWLQRVGGLVARRRAERELAAELESHLQLHIDDNIRAGMTPAEARRQALIKFGPVEAIKEEYRDRSRIPIVESVLLDLRYGARSLRRHTGFAVLAVSTLALGVGATAAMFGLVDALMRRPLPHVREPDRLGVIEEIANYARYKDVGGRINALDLAGFMRLPAVSLGTGAQARPIDAECVTLSYFPVLGATPSNGRAFAADEDRPGGEPVVVIAHGLWMRQFGGDPAAVGAQARIGGQDHTIIGIAPSGFRGISRQRVDAWVLFRSHQEICFGGDVSVIDKNDSGFWWTTIARIRTGFTREQATADAVAADSNPVMMQSRRADGTLETRRITKPPQLTPIRESFSSGGPSDDRLALWLAGGAIVLLLISCANVAGLLAARAVTRRREIAVRMQLGASRGRVFQQLLAENVVIAALCAAAAIAVAAGLEPILLAYYPLPDGDGILGGRTVPLLVAFALAAGLMSGAVPAFQASRADVSRHLRTGRAMHERTWFRTMLLMTQVSLALVLIVGAGLFVRSVANYGHEFGFDVDRTLVASVDFGKAGLRQVADARARYDQMLERVRQLPDVERAALSNAVAAGARGGMVTGIGRRNDDPDSCCHLLVKVSPDYFTALGMRIVRGRAFTDADVRAGAARVVILEEDLAKRIFAAEDPIGQCVLVMFNQACVQVVGVSESARRGLLRTAQIDSQFFLPLTASADSDDAPQMLVVRPRSSSRSTMATIAAAIRTTAPDLPYVDIQPAADLVNVEARRWRMGATLFGLFGTLAVALAAIGIYASLAFSVRQRTPEIGVRVAFGAEPIDIGSMVVRHALFVAGVGWIVGALATLALTNSIKSMLFGVAPGDPATFVGASLVVLAAAIVGSVIPAIRAARIDPAAALRAE